MTNTQALLALLQVTDSAFPSGAFVHSYGLEQLVRERRLTDAAGLECFVRPLLHESLATADAAAAYAAARATTLEELIEIDEALFATKAASELREACVATGRRFLEEANLLSGGQAPGVRQSEKAALLSTYALAVTSETGPGCYAVAYGAVCRHLGVDADDVPGAYLQGTVTAILQSAQRLMRVSHRDVQAALHRLRPQVAEIADGIVSRSFPQSFGTFNPLQDIASMRHELAEARLFAS